MNVPWGKVLTIAGLTLSSVIQNVISLKREEKIIADVGESVGKEILNTVKKEIK